MESILFSSSQIHHIESRFPLSQIIPQTRMNINSDCPISDKALSSMILSKSRTQSSDQIRPSLRVLPSVNFSRSPNCPSQPGLQMSEIVVKANDLRSSRNATFSCRFNQNNEKGSLQWFSSKKIKVSVFPLLQSQTPETTAAFFSNPFMPSVSNFPSILFQTLNIMTPMNNQLKAAMESVTITSGAAGGGALVALLTICCLCFVFHERLKSPEIERQTVDETDLPTELSEEEDDDEDENDVDGTNAGDLFDSETDTWVGGRIRRGDDLRMDFDGDESF
jgi:hypothetical protein